MKFTLYYCICVRAIASLMAAEENVVGISCTTGVFSKKLHIACFAPRVSYSPTCSFNISFPQQDPNVTSINRGADQVLIGSTNDANNVTCQLSVNVTLSGMYNYSVNIFPNHSGGFDYSKFGTTKENYFFAESTCIARDENNLTTSLDYEPTVNGKSVKHQCRLPVNLNVTIDDVIHDVWTADNVSLYNVTLGECTVEMNNGSHVIFTSHCVEGYTYNDDDQSSFVTEWALVCNDQYLSDVSQVVYVGGQMFGSLFFTRFADTHGRKKVLTVTSLLFQVCTLACSFPPNFTVYLVLKFTCGAFIACSYQVSVILMLELLPKERRAIVEQLKTFLWSTSLLFLCFIAYVTRQLSWHYTQLTLSLISLYVVVLWWVTDESLPWLFAANKLKEAEVLLQKIARINKVNYEKVSNILKNNNFVQFEMYAGSDTQLSDAGQSGDAKQEDHVLVFLKNRYLLKLTLISSFLSFTVTMVYEGLLMMSPNLTEDFYLGFVLGVVTEFPATVLFSFLINRIGRKKCIYIFQIIAGVFLLLSTVLSETPLSDNIPGRYWVSLVTSLIGRLAFSVSYSSVVLYVTELFPTSVRNTGCGIAGVGTYFGSMIAPYARTLSRRLPLVPTTIISLLCLVVPFTILNLPETNGRELAHTLEDLERVMTVRATRPKPFCRRLLPCWYSKHAVLNTTHNEVSVHVVHIESSSSCTFSNPS